MLGKEKFFRIGFRILNFYSFSNLSYNLDGNLRKSNLVAFKNLIYIPLVFSLRLLVPLSVQEAGTGSNMFFSTGFSFFFAIIFSFLMLTYVLMLSLCVFIQWWKREKHLSLILKCLKFHQYYNLSNSQHFKTAEKKFLKKEIVWFSLFFVLQVTEFSIIMKWNWQGVLRHTLNPFKSFSFLILLGFFNCFLSYFEFLMEHLNIQLQKHQIDVQTDMNVERLMRFMKDLHKLMTEFDGAFGLVLTWSVVLITITNTIRVRRT